MYIPQDWAGYLFAVLSLVGWGSWGNMLVAGGNIVRFEVFYIDYTLGILIFTLIFNGILGQLSDDNNGVFSGMTWAGHDFTEVSGAAIGWAIFSGIVFNIANILLSKGITMAGLAIAFPIAIGMAFILGTIWLYLQNQDTTKPGLLFAGTALGAIALLAFSQMYNIKDEDEKKKKQAAKSNATANIGIDVAAEKAAANNEFAVVNVENDIDAEKAAANAQKTVSFDEDKIAEDKEEHKVSFTYMVVLLIVAGTLMSGWGAILGFGSIDSSDPSTIDKLSPYGQMFWFVLAIVFSNLLFIPLMLRFPIDRSEPVPFSVFLQSFRCSWLGHLLCVLGGVIWAFGFLCYVLSASSCSMNNATSYAIGQCAPLAAIFWGALLWKEFNGCRRIVWIYLIASVAFYIGAVVLAAISRETSDDACNISITTPIPTM